MPNNEESKRNWGSARPLDEGSGSRDYSGAIDLEGGSIASQKANQELDISKWFPKDGPVNMELLKADILKYAKGELKGKDKEAIAEILSVVPTRNYNVDTEGVYMALSEILSKDGLKLADSPVKSKIEEFRNNMLSRISSERQDTGALASAGLGMADMATAGLVKPVVSAIKAIGPTDYDLERAKLEGKMVSAANQNPASYLAGEVGGAILDLPGMATRGLLKAGASKIPAIGKGVETLLSKFPKAGGIAKSALVGATSGGSQALGKEVSGIEPTSAGEILGETAKGIGVGAGIGTVLSVIGLPLSGLGKYFASKGLKLSPEQVQKYANLPYKDLQALRASQSADDRAAAKILEEAKKIREQKPELLKKFEEIKAEKSAVKSEREALSRGISERQDKIGSAISRIKEIDAQLKSIEKDIPSSIVGQTKPNPEYIALLKEKDDLTKLAKEEIAKTQSIGQIPPPEHEVGMELEDIISGQSSGRALGQEDFRNLFSLLSKEKRLAGNLGNIKNRLDALEMSEQDIKELNGIFKFLGFPDLVKSAPDVKEQILKRIQSIDLSKESGKLKLQQVGEALDKFTGTTIKQTESSVPVLGSEALAKPRTVPLVSPPERVIEPPTGRTAAEDLELRAIDKTVEETPLFPNFNPFQPTKFIKDTILNPSGKLGMKAARAFTGSPELNVSSGVGRTAELPFMEILQPKPTSQVNVQAQTSIPEANRNDNQNPKYLESALELILQKIFDGK